VSRAAIGHADLLRILRSTDRDGLAELAASLHYDFVPSAPPLPAAPLAPAHLETAAAASGSAESSDWPAGMADVPQWRAVTYRLRSSDSAPPPQPAAPQGIQWRDRPRTPPLYPPLADWRELSPRLRAALVQVLRSSRLDLGQLTNQVARGEVLHEFPRLPIRKWGNAVYVIQDRQNHLMPFWHDYELLLGKLRSLIPAYALDLVVAQNPARMRLLDAGSEYRRFTLPPTGSLVLVLSDLGTLKSDGEALRRAWSTWIYEATGHGARVVVLTPGSLRGLDAAVCGSAHVVTWQPPRTPLVDDPAQRLQLVESLLAMAAPLIRLEPGLLRCFRLALPGAEDASLESDAWQHPALRWVHPAGATIDREIAEVELMPRFRVHRDRWRLIFEQVRQWRAALANPEIYFEEINGLEPAMRGALPRRDVDDAAAAWRYFRGLIGPGESPPRDRDVFEYIRRMSERTTQAAAGDAEFGPLLRLLFRATHPPEQHDRAAGFDPVELPPGELSTLAVVQQGGNLHFTAAGDPRTRPGPGPLATLRTRQASVPIQLPERLATRAGDRKHRRPATTVVRLDQPTPFRLPRTPTFRVVTDLEEIEIERCATPGWASAMGRDRYGLWAEFELDRPDAETTEPLTQRLRWIPPGRFLMGSNDSADSTWLDAKPQHEVVISHGFWLFDTPVRQELWSAVMPENRSGFPGPRRPVERVSWRECREFCRLLAARIAGLDLILPTEAEWEYACRAGTQTAYAFGDTISPADARFGVSDKEGTSEVGAYAPNAWGVFDMHGNVWEWCFDGPRDYKSKAEVDPIGSTGGGARRVFRGGGWLNAARDVRSAYRRAFEPGLRFHGLGFRCALVQVSAGGARAE